MLFKARFVDECSTEEKRRAKIIAAEGAAAGGDDGDDGKKKGGKAKVAAGDGNGGDEPPPSKHKEFSAAEAKMFPHLAHDPAMLATLHEIFTSIDEDGSGDLDAGEVGRVLLFY